MSPSTEEDYHQINNVANKAILQELVENSGDEVTAEILKAYKIGASDSDIKKDFSKWKVAPLRTTAAYLRVETEGKLKADIVNDIISRIEALLMELCAVCNKYYHNLPEDNPVYTCIVCQQGCHQPCYEEVFNALQLLDPKYHKSMQFICSSCQRGYQPKENISADENTSKVKKSPTKPTGDTNEPLEEQQEPPEGDAETPEEGKDDAKTPDKSQISDICPQYKWNKCPNYNQCQYKHPPRCRDLLRDGKCPYKKKCKYHHPPLCKYSIKDRKCINQECKYFHLAKTQRREVEEEKKHSSDPTPSQQLPNSHNQANNNQAPHAHQNPPNLPQQTRSTLPTPNLNQSVDQTQNYMPFLLMTIKQLKEEILGHVGREIADLKQNLLPKQQTTPNVQQTVNQPSSQQVLLNPFLQAMCMKTPTIHPQQS